jgi:thioredoxin 1
MIKAGKCLLVLGMTCLAWYLSCGSGSPKATAQSAKPDSTVAGAICETIPQPASAAAEPAPAPAKPASEPTEKPPAPVAKPPAAQLAGESEKPVATVARPKALPRLWDFGSETCIPCKTMYAILTPMMKEHEGKVDIRIINVYQEQSLAGQYRIQIIPTQVFMDTAGKEVYRHVGVLPRDSILTKFRQLGFTR